MNVMTPGKPFLGRGQVTQIAEERPRTLEAFMTMSLYGLSSTRRSAHGPAIMETLRQVCCALCASLLMQQVGVCIGKGPMQV